MFATKRVRMLAAAALAALLAAGAGAALLGLERLEARRAFCNACHLPDGRPLHEAKLKQALLDPPMDETGAHFQRPGGPQLSCAACHRGTGALGRAAVLWDSFRNSLVYLTGDFEEPERIGRPIADATCTGCHDASEFSPDGGRFHGIRAHALPLPVGCTECHVAHAAGAERAAHLQRVLERLQSSCGACHDVAPPTPDMMVVLRNFARDRTP